MSKPRRKAKPTSDIIDKSLLGTNFVIAVVAGAALLVSVLTFFAANAEANAAQQIAAAAEQQVVAARENVAAARAQLQYAEAQAVAAESQVAAAEEQLAILRREQTERFRPWIGLDPEGGVSIFVLTGEGIFLDLFEWCQSVDCSDRNTFAGVLGFEVDVFVHNYGEQPALSVFQRTGERAESEAPIEVQVDLLDPVGPGVMMPGEDQVFANSLDTDAFIGAIFGDHSYYFSYRVDYEGLDGTAGFYEVIWRVEFGDFLIERISAG